MGFIGKIHIFIEFCNSPNIANIQDGKVISKACDLAANVTTHTCIVDTIPPYAVSGLGSSSHAINVWSKKANVTTTWTPAEDDKTRTNDVSGIGGYGAVWNTTAASLPPEQKTIEAVASTTSLALPDGKSHYFHIRSVDNAGNWDDEAVSMGPFWIDKTAPKISIAVLWEEMDSKGLYVIGRCFRVDVSDPIVNDARSCLDWVKVNGTQYSCNGSASFSKQIYVQASGWLSVTAKDIAGNIGTGDRKNPDPYFIQAPRWEDIHPLDIPFEDYAVSPVASPGIKDSASIDYTLPKPAQVSVRVYNSSGNLIKIIKDADDAIGIHSFTWDGKDASSEPVPDSSYYYVVDGIDYLSDTLVFEKHGLIILRIQGHIT